MWQQIKQVGIAYVSRRWIVVGLLAGVGVSILAVLNHDQEQRFSTPPLFLAAAFLQVIFALCFVAMAKSFFAHPRARLFPGFAAPHIIVLAIPLFGGMAIYPLITAWVDPERTLGLAAVCSVMGCCAIWGLYQNRLLLRTLPMVVFISMITPGVSEVWFGTDINHKVIQAVLLAAGTGGLLAWLWRLPYISEELRVYQPTPWDLGLVTKKAGQYKGVRLSSQHLTRLSWLACFVDRWHDRIDRYPRPLQQRIAWLLRYGFGGLSGGFVVALSIAIIAGFLLLFAAIGLMASGTRPQNFTLLKLAGGLILAWLALWLPTSMAAGRMATRWPLLGYELMRPVARGQLFNGLLRALARDTAMLWISLHVMIGLGLFTIPSREIEPQAMATFVLLSLALQPVYLSLLLALGTQWGKPGVSLGTPAMAVASYGIFLFWLSVCEFAGNGVLLAVAVLIACLGITLGVWVRRRWTNLEFG